MMMHFETAQRWLRNTAGSLVLLLGGCASANVIGSREAATTRPTDYTTFRVNEPKVGQIDSELSDMLAEGLERKGYRPAGERAELVVTYKLLLGSMDGRSSESNEPPAVVHDDMFSRAMPVDERETKILLVLIQDARTLDTLWVGWSHAEAKEDEVEARARSALEQLVEEIPSRDEASSR